MFRVCQNVLADFQEILCFLAAKILQIDMFSPQATFCGVSPTVGRLSLGQVKCLVRSLGAGYCEIGRHSEVQEQGQIESPSNLRSTEAVLQRGLKKFEVGRVDVIARDESRLESLIAKASGW